MINALNRLFARPKTEVLPSTVAALYGVIMTAARQSKFFGPEMVDDNFENRFEFLVLHMFLVLDRLKADGQAGYKLGQCLVEFMVSDLDRTCREMGIGDVGVVKQMKNFMSGFYGRLKAYEAALNNPDTKEILRALDNNLLASRATDIVKLQEMRDYLVRQKTHLATLSFDDLQNGRICFSH